MALLECAWHGTWSMPGMALGLAHEGGNNAYKRRLQWRLQWRLDWCLKEETTPANGVVAHLFRPPDWNQNGAPHRHRSNRRCKEDTVPSFYALRLVFILFIFYFYFFWWDELIEDKISKFNLYKTMILNIWIQLISKIKNWLHTVWRTRSHVKSKDPLQFINLKFLISSSPYQTLIHNYFCNWWKRARPTRRGFVYFFY